MKNTLTLIIILACFSGYCQNLDSIVKLPSVQQTNNLKQIIKKGESWIKLSSYELKNDTIFKHQYSYQDTFKFSKNKFTIPKKCNDKSDCPVKGKVKYFGSCMTLKYHRLEKSTYCLVGLYGNYLILETVFHPNKIETKSKTKNGKTVIKGKSVVDKSKTIHMRYVFKKHST